eukprot:SAG11_NODE_527_length_8731_cov_3.883457_8_plen_54_part_00
MKQNKKCGMPLVGQWRKHRLKVVRHALAQAEIEAATKNSSDDAGVIFFPDRAK